MEFQAILAVAQQVSDDTRCFIDVRDNSEYGWMNISLSVDKFGGCAVNLSYKIDTGRCFDWIGMKNEKEIDLSMLYSYARKEVERLRDVRCTDDLYDFINSQY